jgi:putative redox protein
MKVRVKWVEDVSFLAESESGHCVVMDGAPAQGGRNIGPRPMELMLMGMGGCASFDVITILKKSRQDVSNCEVHIEADRKDEIPAVFTKINMVFTVTGNNLKDTLVKRAVELSAEKYCSASKMFEDAGVKVTHDYIIKD